MSTTSDSANLEAVSETVQAASAPPRRFVVSALIVCLPPILLAGVIPMGGLGALEDDLLYYFPQRVYFGQAIRQGQFPLWNRYAGMGVPLAADPQAGIWYPPTYLFAVLGPFAAYLLTLWLHFVLAGAGMYRLARGLGRSPHAALVAGLAFEFGGFLIGHRAHLTILESAAWAPWVILAWVRFAERQRRRDFAAGVLLLGVQLLVQHVQISLITTAVTFGYLLVAYDRRWKVCGRFLVGVGLSVGIAAIQFLPTLAHFARCTRSETTYDTLIENSFWPQSLILVFWPMLFGSRTPNFYTQDYWGPSHWCEQAIYPSLLVAVLALAAIGAWRRDRQVRAWLIVGAGALFLAAGQFNPVYHRLHGVPFINSLRVPARWMLALAIILPLLAATTLDQVRRADGGAIRRTLLCASRVVPALMLVGLAIAVVLSRLGQVIYPFSFIADTNVRLSLVQPAVYVPLVLWVLTLLALAGFRRRGRAWSAGVVVLLVVDLASVASFVDVDVSTYKGKDALLASPLAEFIRERDEGVEGRLWVPRPVADYHRPVEVLWPNVNLLHGVPTLHGYGPLTVKEQRALWQVRPWGSMDGALDWLCRPELLEAMGVRWVAVRSEAERNVLGGALKPAASAALVLRTEPGLWSGVFGTRELRLPVSLARAGLYRVEFTARVRYAGTGTRFYVSLEDEASRPIAPIRYFEPADSFFGQRRFRIHFAVDGPVGEGVLRLATFRGAGVEVADVRCGFVASRESAEPIFANPQAIGDVLLYELPGAAARISFARRTVAVGSIAAGLDYLTVTGDPGGLQDTAVVLCSGAAPSAGSGAAVRSVTEGPNRIEALVEAPEGGFLVFRDTYDPGWRALVDGKEASVFRTNVVCGGVAVGPGSRRVELIYRPVGLWPGVVLSVVSLALIYAGSVVVGRKRPRDVAGIEGSPRGGQAGGT